MTDGVAIDRGGASADDDRPKTLVERFLEVRGLKKSDERKKLARGHSQSTIQSLPRLPPSRPVWAGYTKRIHGDRTAFLRRAMAIPDEDFGDSVDAYNPKKREKQFIKIHEESGQVSVEFLYITRSQFFERDVVDQEVCDLMENQELYDQRLDGIYEIESDH